MSNGQSSQFGRSSLTLFLKFLVSNTDPGSESLVKSDPLKLIKKTRVFFKKQTAQGVCFVNEDSRIQT